jgi:hypothetical protein
LVQERVDQSRLAVVDVGDDGDIADIQRLSSLVKNKTALAPRADQFQDWRPCPSPSPAIRSRHPSAPCQP